MFADGLTENLKGWLSLLSGTWGILLLPFAISLFCGKKHRLAGIALVMLVGAYCLILLHDINAHFKNKRPWIPFYEWCLGLAVPVESGHVLASAPFDVEKATVTVAHVRRGRHSLGIWIPAKMNDFTPIEEDIEFDCTFLDKMGKTVFQVHSNNAAKKLWTWCRGSRGGSKTVHCIYSVPEDVPLDDELSLRIDASGNVEEFLRRHPGALLTVEKYSDK